MFLWALLELVKNVGQTIFIKRHSLHLVKGFCHPDKEP